MGGVEGAVAIITAVSPLVIEAAKLVAGSTEASAQEKALAQSILDARIDRALDALAEMQVTPADGA
jgi:hypothetical protein